MKNQRQYRIVNKIRVLYDHMKDNIAYSQKLL